MKKTIQTSEDYSTKNRSIARSVAKHRAKASGYSRICSKPLVGSSDSTSLGMKPVETKGKKGKSWFSQNWKAV